MFLTASKVKTWNSGLIDNRFLKIDSNNYLLITVATQLSERTTNAEINKTKDLCLVKLYKTVTIVICTYTP